MSPAPSRSDPAFEVRAKRVVDLLLPHRQFQNATARFEIFAASASPDYDDAETVSDQEEAGFSFREDEEEADAHVQALMILGPPGTGKSGVLTWIERRPGLKVNRSGLDGDVVPVHRIVVPDPPTPKELVKEICASLNSPVPTKWTRGEVSRHLRRLFWDIKLQYLQMDEAHVLAEDLTAAKLNSNARFLKYMLVSCRVPIILAGEEPLEVLLTHRALKRRMQAPVRMAAYRWETYPEVQEWMGLAGSLADHLGFGGTAVGSDVDLAMRLYLDTGGVIGLLAQRLVEAGRHAVAEPTDKLTKKHFSLAWHQWRSEGSGVATDPFIIIESASRDSPDDPYVVDVERFKELWKFRFHGSGPKIDTSRQTRRGSRGAQAADASFGA